MSSIVPVCFESYARVFHPASRFVTNASDAASAARSFPWIDGTTRWEKLVRWTEVADANGRVMHPAAEWGSITGSLDYIYNDVQPDIWDQSPALGAPPFAVADRLLAVLRMFTDTPEECWFGVSDIWAGPLRDHLRAAPKFGTPGVRSWFLLGGPVQSAIISPDRDGDHLPDLWWPEDRSWFVGSDVDLLSTYVGGSRACIRALLADKSLEVLEVPADQGVAWDTDTINPLPPTPD